MGDLRDGLAKMFFDLQVVTRDTHESAVLIFSISCAIIGLVAVILDFFLFVILDESPLKLKHGTKTFVYLMIWPIGSLFIGWIGQMIEIFKVSLSAALTVGFTWPILCAKFIKNQAEKETEDEPEQVVGEEN